MTSLRRKRCAYRPCLPETAYSYFSFPKEPERIAEWLKACNREDLLSKTAEELHKNYRLCEKHFEPTFYSIGNIRKRLWDNAIPTIFRHNMSKNIDVEDTVIVPEDDDFLSMPGKPSDLRDENDIDWVPSIEMGYDNDNVSLKRHRIAVNRQKRTKKRRNIEPEDISEVTPNEVETFPMTDTDKQCQTDVTVEEFTKRTEINYSFFKDDDIKTKYYTGLNSFKKLEIFVSVLRDHIPSHFNSSLPIFEQVLLTMMKLRLNLDFEDLGFRFGISPTTASTYFKNMIDLMYRRLKKFIIWPSRDSLEKTMPDCFSDAFSEKISVILDYFEFYIEKPYNLLKCSQYWSNSKHHYTVKYLIGISPQGTINFISEAWGGQASDEHVIVNSKFLDNIIPGDIILADRGFSTDEDMKMCNVDLKMLAFTKIKNKLHPVELEETKSIEHVRIHVESIMDSIRNKFRILTSNRTINLLACSDDDPIFDKIVTVCCALINLCPPKVPLTVT